MTLTSDPTETDQAPPAAKGRWISDWRPEDETFWEERGSAVARRNLIWSIFAEHLGFSVWLIWSVSSAFLVATGFDYSPQQLFLLLALPNLVGSLLRLPYTFAVPKFGGRNWTVISALLLIVPCGLLAWAVSDPSTSYTNEPHTLSSSTIIRFGSKRGGSMPVPTMTRRPPRASWL